MRKGQFESQQSSEQEKIVYFRQPKTQHIYAQFSIPPLVKMKNYHISIRNLSKKLSLLLLDVLSRGFHPKHQHSKDLEKMFENQQKQAINLIQITEIEAIATIWKCLSRQIGRPLKNCGINEVKKKFFEEIKNLRSLKRKQQSIKIVQDHERFEKSEKYLKIQEKIDQLEGLIDQELKVIAQKSKQQNERQIKLSKSINLALKTQILNQEKKIFNKTLIGIRQYESNTDLVQLVFEQSYPYVKMLKQAAKKLLGQTVFNEKSEKYQKNKRDYIVSDGIMVACHRCLRILNLFERAGQCDDKWASLMVGHTFMTDPYIYCKQIINEEREQISKQSYIHPYLIYYPAADNNQKALCNRYLCSQCETEQLKNKGSCPFCEGTCDCERCQGMDQLTKMMAIFLDNKGDLSSLTDKFMMKFPIKNLATKSKKQIKKEEQLNECFDLYQQSLFEQKIFKQQKDLKSFCQVRYYPAECEIEQLQQFERIRNKKLKSIEIQQTKDQQMKQNDNLDSQSNENKQSIEKASKKKRSRKKKVPEEQSIQDQVSKMDIQKRPEPKENNEQYQESSFQYNNESESN